MLKHFEANPLNVHGLRQLNFCPPHFTQIKFDTMEAEKDLINWLLENLEGRFYIGTIDVKSSSRGFNRQRMIAFEHAAEASYFALMLPQINSSSLILS